MLPFDACGIRVLLVLYGSQTHRTMSTTIYCASNGYSGVWAFSPEAIRAYAPKEMLEGNEYSTGEVWEATLGDLDGALWAFSPVV